jgi:hypothetical protein
MPTNEQFPGNSSLREEYLDQAKLYDFTVQVSGDTNPLFVVVDASKSNRSEVRETIAEHWLSMLKSNTSLNEVFYLLGVEEEADRVEKIHQLLEQASDSEIGYGLGETLGDLRESGAPNLYLQLFQPQLRPKFTPEGYQFPYSHFGETVTRTELLRDIKRDLSLSPEVVVNMGSGYDITPSDSFLSSRVIHVDIDSEIVEFLRRSGFEAYHPEDFPDDLYADLVISLSGPGLGNIPVSPRGVLLTDAINLEPVGMKIKGLVPYTEEEILPVVSDPIAIEELLSTGQALHLAVYTIE